MHKHIGHVIWPVIVAVGRLMEGVIFYHD